MVAAMLWQIFKPEQSRNVVVHLERHTDIAMNPHVVQDGRHVSCIVPILFHLYTSRENVMQFAMCKPLS